MQEEKKRKKGTKNGKREGKEKIQMKDEKN